MERADLSVSFESTPAMTSDEVEQMFNQLGDDAFHDDVAAVNCVGEAPAEVAPSHIGVELTSRGGGKVEGMEIELEAFLRRYSYDCERDIGNIAVSVVPTDEEIEQATPEIVDVDEFDGDLPVQSASDITLDECDHSDTLVYIEGESPAHHACVCVDCGNAV